MIGLLLIKGGVWLSERITPWLFGVSWLTLFLAFLGFLPLCASKETRGVGGLGLFVASYIFGVTLWFWSLLLTYTLWGGIALIIGLLFAGVGVVPIALLATAFKGEWAIFGELLLLLVATFGTRGLGFYFLGRYDQDPGEPDVRIKLIVSTWLLFAISLLPVPYVAYITYAPFMVCGLILIFSKNRTARKHGKYALGGFIALLAIFFVIGFIFYKKFS